MAEFPAHAKTMVGNNNGPCLLHLTGAAITVRFTQSSEESSWPYNCIRQFRADEDTRQFSFYSGRRGPYGVAEYKFDMNEPALLALQDALTQFTGAQFGGSPPSQTQTGSGSRNSVVVSGAVSGTEQFRSPKRDPLPQIPGAPPSNTDIQPGYSTHVLPEARSLNHYHHHGQQGHSAADLFATLTKEQRNRHNSSSPGRPPVPPPPYNSQTLGAHARRGAPSVNMKYHEVAGNFPPQGGRGAGFSGAAVPPFVPPVSNRKLSHGDDIFNSKTLSSPVRAAKLTRQATAPTHRMRQTIEELESPPHHQGSVFSPPSADQALGEEEGASDLDFTGMLRRSSPQVDRKNRKGRVSPPDASAHNSARHNLYSVPRPSGSASSPPPLTGDGLYQAPRSNHQGDPLSQESAEIPVNFTISPTEKDNMYSVPKTAANGSDLYSAPRPQKQMSIEDTPSTPDVGGTVIYNVPSSKPPPINQPQPQQPMKLVRPLQDHRGQELYNVPRVAAAMATGSENGHEFFYNTPRASLESSVPLLNGGGGGGIGGGGVQNGSSATDGLELYNVPRSARESFALQTEDDDSDGQYKVPRSLDALDVYSVPKPKRENYDSLEAVHSSADYKSNNGRGAPFNDPADSRQPMPTPDQDMYNVPRPSNSTSPSNGRRYPYDYVDHTLPRTANGKLKPSRSLESLVHNRVKQLSPDHHSQHRIRTVAGERSNRTRTLKHKYIEIDIDDLKPSPSSVARRGRLEHQHSLQEQEQQRTDNLYAEISDAKQPQHLSHPNTLHRLDRGRYTSVPSNLRATYAVTATNNTPLPTHSRIHHSSSSGAVNSVSKEARALHQEGYELVLPADKAARNLALRQQATQPVSIGGGGRTHSVSTAAGRQAVNNNGGSGQSGNWAVSQFSTSGPQCHQNSGTDEYVIVNRRDVNQPTQPRDIPVPLPQTHNDSFTSLDTTLLYRPPPEDQYEVMTSVKKQVVTNIRAVGGPHGVEFSMVPPVPTKKRGSVSSTHGSVVSQTNSLPRSDVIGRQSLRNSLDLESVETGSRASTCSSNDVVGPLSPIDPGTHSLSIAGKKNVVRIASGSPHDISPSKDLKIRSNSIENFLDDNDRKQKYENVTDEDLAANKHALSASLQLVGGGSKKPPRPLPRPARPEH